MSLVTPFQPISTWGRSRRRARSWLVAAGVVSAASAGGCAGPSADVASGRALLDEVAALGTERVIEPRLSVSSRYRPCVPSEPPGGSIPRASCGAERTARSDRSTALSRRAGAAVEDQVDPQAMHAAALVNILWGDTAGIWLHESISYLQAAARLANDPDVLADLAASHLLRAERQQTPRDLLEAVEQAERALQLDSTNVAAIYNLALALDRLGLDDEATSAWERYLRVDPESGWATEARGRRNALKARPGTAGYRAVCGGVAPDAAELVTHAPQEALLLGWNCLLGEWGEAVLQGDEKRAETKLGLAGSIGAGLERRGGDATLADAVRAVRALAHDRSTTRGLAEAHLHYARGRASYAEAKYDTAAARFGRAAAGADGSPALRQWARLFEGAALVNLRAPARAKAGRSVIERAVAEADTARHPALAGRARWILATTLFWGGKYQAARDRYQDAERFLARAGEREHVGAVQHLRADVEFTMGDVSAAYTSMHRALMTLRRYRGSLWLHNLLSATAQAAVADGLTRAAMRLHDEDVAVAGQNAQAFYAAEALFARSRLLSASGRMRAAASDVGAGQQIVERLSSPYARNWFQQDLNLSTASMLLHRDPARAATALDPVVAFFAKNANPIRLVPALTRRAEARLALGDAEAAIADLDSTTRVLSKLRRDISTAALQASLLDAAQGVFDRLVMLSVQKGRAREALGYLERGRLSFAAGPGTRSGPPGAPVSPPGEVAVEHALIGDTLLIWTVAGSDVRLTRRTVDEAHLLDLIERTRSALELRADTAAARGLQELYDVVLQPVRERLGPPGTPLVLIADGEIAGIPFAALYDAARERYFVQDHPLRFAGSLHDARSVVPKKGSATRALLVADPAFDPAEYPGLERLAGASAEAGAIRALYPRPVVLAGAQAGREQVQATMAAAEVVHYAGHAVFDDQRPEQSFLLLSAGRGSPHRGRLTAGDVEALDLRPVRLVVLSACRTLRSRNGRSGGFAGFSGALLSAGAGGVVGSLWSVSDSLTRPLMVRFHTAYRASGDGAGALQRAQLDMLRSKDPALQSPATWAGFRYAGN